MTNLAGLPPRQKQPPLVSRKLRQSARGQPCTLRLPCCNHDPETTVLAHLRYFGWAGVAEKPHDLLAVYACGACHAAMDSRDADSGMFGFEEILRALGETLMCHYHAGRVEVK